MSRRLGALAALIVGLVGCAERADRTAGGGAPPSATSPPSAPAPAPAAAPAAPPAKSERLVVLVGGDVNLGRGAGQRVLKDSSYDPFHALAPLLKTADLRLVNLESQLSDQGGETQHPVNPLVFTGPPGGADVLRRAGIDLVSLANNHVWDYGKRGFLETLANLERAGVRYAGASREPGRMYEPAVIRIRGWTVAVFGVTDIWNQGPIQDHEGRHHVAWAAFEHLREPLRRAREAHDLVLVLYHGGGEYQDVPMQWTRDFVGRVMNVGVDAFFGHHPHVPQGVGWHGDRPAFYSLGNLVFAMHSDYPWTGVSFMARVTFHADGRLEAEACPYHILGHVPLPFEGETRAARERAFGQHLLRVSAATGGTRVGPPGDLSCVPLGPRQSKDRG